MMTGMAVVGIYKLLKSGDLDSFEIKDLRLMEIKLNKKIDDLHEEINDVAKAIQKYFEKAQETKTQSEEITIANRIKTLSQKKDMKQNAVVQLEKEQILYPSGPDFEKASFLENPDSKTAFFHTLRSIVANDSKEGYFFTDYADSSEKQRTGRWFLSVARASEGLFCILLVPEEKIKQSVFTRWI